MRFLQQVGWRGCLKAHEGRQSKSRTVTAQR
jgi:hypothetical protein